MTVLLSWNIQYGKGVDGADERGQAIDICDPLAVRLAAVVNGAGADSRERVGALLAFSEIFEPQLAANTTFVEAMTTAYDNLIKHDA